MAKRIKQEKFNDPAIKKTPSKINFNFSELREISYSKAKNDGLFFINFLRRLNKLCSLTWKDAERSARHSFGSETMLTSRLTASAQHNTPSGIDTLKVFRATGDNHVFLGYREDDIFYIVFIEYQFGDIYSHS